MALVIRLTRMGKKGERRFRLVVKEKRSRRDGASIEELGWFEKRENGSKKEVNRERALYWISKGAKASPTVSKLLNL